MTPTPTYNGVRVTGQGPIRMTAGDTGDDARVYGYTDLSIRDPQAATATARALLDEFERQQR